MSIFEAIMIICFGAAWPFSIYKSYKTKDTNGKSVMFLIIVLLGYIAGIIHKILYHFDLVSYLYILNLIMVLIDIILFFQNKKLQTSKNYN